MEVGSRRSWPPPRNRLPRAWQAPGGSPGGMETSSPPTVLPTSTALARAIADMNILALVQNSSYLTGLNAQLLAGVPGNARDALDMAGKLPLALKANAIGIPPHELNIDPAQAGGLLGKFDATISGSGGFQELQELAVSRSRERAAAAATRRPSSCRGCGRARASSTSSWWCAAGTLLTGQTCSSSTTSSGWDTCRAPPSTGR